MNDIRSFIASRIDAGFESVHDITKQATAHACETHDCENMEPAIKSLIAELLVEHRRKQSDWQGETDCEKLDQAFDALNKLRIVARQNFSCCNNCGRREIWDEIEEVEKKHTVDGYVFYHQQCTQDAVASGQLLMAYGSVEEGEECLQRVGRTVVRELQKVWLDAEWNGNIDSPIIVTGLVWRCRILENPVNHPLSRYGKYIEILLTPFIVLAAIGFLLTLIAHICAIVGLPQPLGAATEKLYVGIFVVWLPAVLASIRLSRDYKRKELWKATLRGCPNWMRYMAYGVFIYPFLNFMLCEMAANAGQQARNAPPLFLRMMTGVVMVFYFLSVAILYSAIVVAKRDPARRCPNGHPVSPSADFCGSCGAKISDS